MSTLYNLEPQPTAKVLLNTTSGDLLIELFAKQTPLASRSFLQHCLDGYYDSTVFHRLVPGFIIQGGDPTGTGHGGEAIWPGGTFEDEFHSRLKFNRRGLLGMANGGGKNDNGSQFFLTLGETRELQDKHTMFGRIMGDTIYNLMKMGDAELEGSEGIERPLYPTKILRADVLVNPFDDMVRKEPRAKALKEEKQEVRKKVKKRSGKTLLSFGVEDGDDGPEQLTPKKDKYNPTLVNDSSVPSTIKGFQSAPQGAGMSVEKVIRKRSTRSKSPPQITQPNQALQCPLSDAEKPSRSLSSSPELEQVRKVSTLLDKTNAQIADLKASMKRTVAAAPVTEERKKSALEQLIPENATRGRKRKHGLHADTSADKQTLDIMNAFKIKLEKASKERVASQSSNDAEAGKAVYDDHDRNLVSAEPDEEAALCDLHFLADCQSCQSWDHHETGDMEAQDDKNEAWMSHALSFEKDRLGKDLTWKKKNEEELLVIDPREKEKDIRESQRAKKMARIGRAKAWDLDRDKGRTPDRRAGQKV